MSEEATEPTARPRKKIAALPKQPKKTATQIYEEKQEAQNAALSTVTPANAPASFAALHKDQLIAAAQYFGTVDEGPEELICADLEEAGVTWAAYCEAFNLPHEEATPSPDFPTPVEDWEEAEQEVEVSEVVTQSPVPTLAADSKYLVKFVGDNPYFEYKRYKFTQDRPYAIMPAADAQEVLELPEFPPKFRQAFPAELQEFYS